MPDKHSQNTLDFPSTQQTAIAGPSYTRRSSNWRNLPRHQATAGHSVGIICLPGVSALIPGNVQNASTFNFPVRYQVLHDLSFAQIAKGDPSAIPAIELAARKLENEGVRAIVGACGSLGHYQSAVANAVSIPVFMSILTQVPFLLSALASDKKLIVVFATTESFTNEIRHECGINDSDRIIPIGLMDCPAFAQLMQSGQMCDGDALLQEMIERIENKFDESVSAFLLQCSDLPPFAAELQHYFGLPVFDMTGLIDWLHAGVVRRHFHGYM